MSGDVAIEAPGAVAEPVAPDQQAPDQQAPEAPPAPVIRVERGNPTPEQLAALALVLSAASANGQGGTGQPRPRTLWTARARFARPRPAVGPGGWRASALPR